MGWLDATLPVVALGWDKSGASVLTWVFEGGASPSLVERAGAILQACSFNDDPQFERYAIFGIDASLGREWKIEDMVALPANVSVFFENEKSKARAVFRRWGLASFLLAGKSLQECYRSAVATDKIAISSFSPVQINGKPGLCASYSAPREFHGDRYMGRTWENGRALVWHDTSENRINVFEQIGPKSAARLDPVAADGRIRSLG